MRKNVVKNYFMIGLAALFVAFFMLQTEICANSDLQEPVFRVESENVVAGDELHIKVFADNNPGLLCTKLGLYYNRDYFTVVSSSDTKEVFPSGFYVSSTPQTYPYIMVWVSISESEADGQLGEIVLKCNENTPAGEYEFFIDYSEDDTCNKEGLNVEFSVSSAKAEVLAKEGVEAVQVENPSPIFTEKDGFKPFGTFENFVKKNTYDDTVYTDIDKQAWYKNDIESAYEYGIMLGKEEMKFAPDENISLAESIALASRMNDLYYGGSGELKTANAGNWYEVYVNYAKKKRIYDPAMLGEDFERPVLRKEFAMLMSKALPKECYEAINEVSSLPDMEESDAYNEFVIKLYNAGILNGNDEKLSFYPDNFIKRSEAAAVVNRMALKENRKKLS